MITTELEKRQNIVLAVDGSKDAWAAIDLVRELPLSAESCIRVVSVLIPREASKKAWALMSVLEQTEERLASTGVKVSTELLTGYPADEVMGVCEKQYPDLIVVGATGLRSTIGILLGGVAQQIVEYARCPVLVVRAPYASFERVLLVVDSSYYSEKAAEYLTRFPLMGSARVHVLHVLPPVDTPELVDLIWLHSPAAPVPDAVLDMNLADIERAEEEEQKGLALLEKMEACLGSTGLDVTIKLCRGDAATEIIGYAKANHIDVVVAGSRGLSQVRGWLLGSVSRKLVHYSECSVIIVKPPVAQ